MDQKYSKSGQYSQKRAIFFNNSGILCLLLVFFAIFSFSGCATKGLVTEEYDADFYRVPKLLPDILDEDPAFIVYGDTQADWRISQKFLRKENWLTWKMAIFPFYELCWLGNGAVGIFNRLRCVPDYGSDSRRMMRDAILKEWKTSPIDFILNTGDICAYDGSRPQHWALFLRENRQERSLLDEVPYLPTAGNHDRVNNLKYGRQNYQAVFDYPLFYYVESPNMGLFVVDSNVMIDWKGEIEDDEQDRLFAEWFVSGDPDCPGWLEDELKSCDKPFKVVSMHHCPVSFGHHWTDWISDSNGRNLSEKRKALLDLFAETGVQVVFSGHDHIYQRNVLESGDRPEGDIHFIVSSGGGVPLRDLTSIKEMGIIGEFYSNEGIEVMSESHFKAFHYCIVQVDSAEMQIRTYTVPQSSPEEPALLDEVVIPNPHRN